PQTLTKEKGLDSRMSPTGIYLEINVSENVQNSSHDNIKEAWIIVYYTASDLDRNGDGDCTDIGDIREDTLSLYVFDETRGKWNKLSETMDWVIELGRNTTNIELYGKVYEGYIWAHVTHFSLYALSGIIRTSGTSGRAIFPPTATINVSDTFGFVNTAFVFDGSNSADDGIIESYHWDFGDGSNTTGMIVTHRFSSPGVYTVTLTVTDNLGLTDSTSVNISVYQPNIPPSVPTIAGLHGTTVNTTFILKVVSVDLDNDTIRYHIDWGDGIEDISVFSQNNTPIYLSHRWNKSGYYTIRVFAEDEHNASSKTASFVVLVGAAIQWIDDKLQGFFIDVDGDGTYDFFYNNETSAEISVTLLSSGVYGLDLDGDGVYDYHYYFATGKLEEYQITESDSYIIIYVSLCLILILLFGIALWFWNATKGDKQQGVQEKQNVKKTSKEKKQSQKTKKKKK
ncbi:MAG: PKD domain-containing protein, partial [Candidatus Thermoplasmatota archaeon]|nr:PKD domain-containing protein [Candidatus Thermoplasmatota archaeon]